VLRHHQAIDVSILFLPGSRDPVSRTAWGKPNKTDRISSPRHPATRRSHEHGALPQKHPPSQSSMFANTARSALRRAAASALSTTTARALSSATTAPFAATATATRQSAVTAVSAALRTATSGFHSTVAASSEEDGTATAVPYEDKNLSQVLNEELEHERDTYAANEAIESGPPTPWIAADEEGDCEITLTRTYGENEEISVVFNVSEVRERVIYLRNDAPRAPPPNAPSSTARKPSSILVGPIIKNPPFNPSRENGRRKE
jgi:hypothetical protein